MESLRDLLLVSAVAQEGVERLDQVNAALTDRGRARGRVLGSSKRRPRVTALSREQHSVGARARDKWSPHHPLHESGRSRPPAAPRRRLRRSPRAPACAGDPTAALTASSSRLIACARSAASANLSASDAIAIARELSTAMTPGIPRRQRSGHSPDHARILGWLRGERHRDQRLIGVDLEPSEAGRRAPSIVRASPSATKSNNSSAEPRIELAGHQHARTARGPKTPAHGGSRPVRPRSTPRSVGSRRRRPSRVFSVTGKTVTETPSTTLLPPREGSGPFSRGAGHRELIVAGMALPIV